MTLEQIQAAIPHRDVMLLIDEVVRQDADSIVCSKCFREDEYFFQGHYPGFALVPGVILCEVAMQAGAVLLSKRFADEYSDGEQNKGRVPVVARLNKVKFKRKVRPGDVVQAEVRFREKVSAAYFMEARVFVHDQLAVSFEFVCTY